MKKDIILYYAIVSKYDKRLLIRLLMLAKIFAISDSHIIGVFSVQADEKTTINSIMTRMNWSLY